MFKKENTVMKYLSLLTDAMFVGILWLFTSLPVITAGASTTAGYYVLIRRISDREGSITTDYFKAFKENFKNTTILFAIFFICSLINLLNLFFSPPIPGNFGVVLYILQVLLAIQLTFVYIHVFPLAARFDLGFKQLIKTSVVLANKHLFSTVTHVALLVSIGWLCFNAPVLFIAAPGIYFLFSSYILIKVYRRYKPDMDKDTDINS